MPIRGRARAGLGPPSPSDPARCADTGRALETGRTPRAGISRKAGDVGLRPISHLEEDRSRASHIVTVAAEARDPAAVAAACRRLGLPEPARGTARLFEGEASGLLVRLPGWAYPAVVEAGHRPWSSTTILKGRSGATPAQLGLFLQAYAPGGSCRDRGPQAGPLRHRTGPPRRNGPADHRGRGWRMKTIEIAVDPEGRVRVETKGFAGASAARRAASSRMP